jgi:sugar/nucleoside kinase (ribokinase family)
VGPAHGALARTTTIPPAGVSLAGDPSGAGDVWGATFFSSLLAGVPLLDAIRRAHHFAGAKMGVRGADGLYEHLRDRLAER